MNYIISINWIITEEYQNKVCADKDICSSKKIFQVSQCRKMAFLGMSSETILTRDTLPSWVSYGVSIERILEKIDHTSKWHHNGCDGVSNHQPHNCLLNLLFRCKSKKISKLHVTGLCAGNSPVTGEFPAQRASNAENVSIWWRHHDYNGTRLYISDQFFFFCLQLQKKMTQVQVQLQDLKTKLDSGMGEQCSEEEQALVDKVETLKEEFRELLAEIRHKRASQGSGTLSDDVSICSENVFVFRFALISFMDNLTVSQTMYIYMHWWMGKPLVNLVYGLLTIINAMHNRYQRTSKSLL